MRVGRSVATPRHQLDKCGLAALGHHLDAAIRPIPNPAGQMEAIGHFPTRPAEAHALHPPTYHEMSSTKVHAASVPSAKRSCLPVVSAHRGDAQRLVLGLRTDRIRSSECLISPDLGWGPPCACTAVACAPSSPSRWSCRQSPSSVRIGASRRWRPAHRVRSFACAE